MKILLLSKNQLYKRNWGRELFKQDLKKFHKVFYYGKGYDRTTNFFIPNILSEIEKPDIILSHIFSYANTFSGYELINDIPKVHIEVDYCEPKGEYFGPLLIQNSFYYKSKYDLIFTASKTSVMEMKKHNVSNKIEWLPFSVCKQKYKNLNLEKNIDVMSTFSLNNKLYPNREKVQNLLMDLQYKVFIDKVIHDEYIKKINQSKIFVNSNNIYNFLNMKYTEVLSCGTFLLSDKPEDLESVGFKDGQHLVLYKGLQDLRRKIEYYLKYDKEREQIAKNGMDFVRKNHSNEVRIKQMTEIIKSEVLK